MFDEFDLGLDIDDLDASLVPDDIVGVGDIDGDGFLEVFDLGALEDFTDFQAPTSTLDFDGDGGADAIGFGSDLDADSLNDAIDPFLDLNLDGFDDRTIGSYVAQLQLHSPFADGADAGLVHVESYVRSVADGIEANNLSAGAPLGSAPLEVVGDHFRTVADGVETNNLS